MSFFADFNYWYVLGAIDVLYLIMSIVTYVFYWRDKRIAERNTRRLKQVDRISEKTLHTLELLFGWPGALVAQRTLKHKSKKRPYQIAFWGIVLLHVVVWALVLGLIFLR